MSDPRPEIPPGVLANWRQWFPENAERIATDILARVPAAVATWSLTDLRPLPGGNVGLVFAARADRGDAVLKLSPRDAAGEGFMREAPALARWAPAGLAPEVWGTRDDGLTLLLERVRPGASLRDTGAGAEAILRTIGTLCPRIHLPVDPGSFPRLRDHARAERWLTALGDARERDELARLLEPDATHRLLHTDLHWLNALRGKAGWMVIDPNPCVGDPHAEVFAFFDGPPLSGISADPAEARRHVARLLGVYANASGLDPDRLGTWVRLRALTLLAGSGPPKRAQLARLIDAVR